MPTDYTHFLYIDKFVEGCWKLYFLYGAWGSVALLVGRSRDRFPVVSLGIFSVVPPDGTMCPGVESVPENEYQGFLLG